MVATNSILFCLALLHSFVPVQGVIGKVYGEIKTDPNATKEAAAATEIGHATGRFNFKPNEGPARMAEVEAVCGDYAGRSAKNSYLAALKKQKLGSTKGKKESSPSRKGKSKTSDRRRLTNGSTMGLPFRE